MTAVQGGRAGRQRQTVGWLRERVVVVEAECQALRAERDQLACQVERLASENQRLQARVGAPPEDGTAGGPYRATVMRVPQANTSPVEGFLDGRSPTGSGRTLTVGPVSGEPCHPTRI